MGNSCGTKSKNGVKNGVTFLKNSVTGELIPQFIISGPPACGKGTQCAKIMNKYKCVHISTGDLLRAEVDKMSEIGKKAKAVMDEGKLVDDDLVIGLVRARLQLPDCVANGWLLDGFPRTPAQAKALQTENVIPNAVVILNVPDDVLIKRVAGRRTDPVTNAVYHLEFNKPPDDKEILDRYLLLYLCVYLYHKRTGLILVVFVFIRCCD